MAFNLYDYIVQGDFLARGRKLLSTKNYVNQLTDDELTTGYYQQNGAICHTSNASMREIESFFQDSIISKKNWPPRSPDLTAANYFLWGLLKGKVYKNTPRTIVQLKDAIRQEIEAVNVDTLGKVFQNLEKTYSSVLGCERRPVSATSMNRSCFASFPVCVYQFSSHYLNNIIFIDNSLGPLATESPCSLHPK